MTKGKSWFLAGLIYELFKIILIGGIILMVLALQIILAVCFVGIAGMLIVDINKNHKGELKEAGGKKWHRAYLLACCATSWIPSA